MKEKIVLITGANSGIGKETTRALAKKGATIIMACRNLEKAGPVCEMIQTESKRGGLHYIQARWIPTCGTSGEHKEDGIIHY